MLGTLCWRSMSRSGATRNCKKQRERKILIACQVLRDHLRKQRNLTLQDQLARSMGVKQAFVSKSETGERRLDFIDLIGICDVLGMSIVKFAERFEASRKASKCKTVLQLSTLTGQAVQLPLSQQRHLACVARRVNKRPG